MTDKFALLANIAADWWWEMDADLRFTFFSERRAELVGWPLERLLGKRRDELDYAGQDTPEWRAHLDDLANRRPFRDLQAVFIDKNGAPRAVKVSGTPLFAADGTFEGYIGVGHDLTELRQREKEAAEQAANLAAILQNIEQGVVLFDAELKIAAYNRRLLELLEIDESWAAQGRSYEEVLNYLADRGEYEQEDRDTAISLRLQLVQSHRPFAAERRRRDGRIISVSFSPLPAGGGVMTYSDVTEARDREARQLDLTQKLEQERTRLVTAQTVAKVGSWETDLTTLKVAWSAETFRIFEADPATFSPTHEGFLLFVHPDDRTAVDEAFRKSFETREVCTFEHRILTIGGGLKYVIERWQIDVDEDGKPVRAVGTCQDFTELKLAEQKAEEAANLLSVAGRAARLGGWTATIDEGRIVWSDVTADIHEEPRGFSPSVDKGLGYYAPEYRKKAEDAFFRCAFDGTPFDETLQIVTARQRRVWVRTIGEAVRDRTGQITAVHGALQDISELVEAREESQRLAERLHQTLDKINDAFVTIDTEWRFSFINQEAMKLLQRSDTDLIGKSIRAEFPDLVGSSFETNFRRAVEKGEVVSFTEVVPELARWFSVRAYPSTEGLAVYFQDVTDTRAQQEQLALLETAVSRLNDIVLITAAEPLDEPGPRIVYVNDAFTRITGYSREEAIGRTPRFLQGLTTSRKELARIRAALENGQPVQSELSNYTRTGKEIWLELQIVPIVDEAGRQTHYVAVQRDVTERKAIEQAIAISEQRFRTVAQLTSDVVWDWDLVEDTLWRNHEGISRFGYEPDVPIIKAEAWTNQVHPDDRERTSTHVRTATAGTATYIADEYRLRRADGSYAQVLSRGSIIRNEDGKAIRIVGSTIDVTEQRRLEQEVHQSQERYRMLFESAPYAVMVSDFDTRRVIATNDAAVRQYGWSREELLSMTVDDFYMTEDLPALMARRRTFSAEETQLIRGLRHRRKDGTFIDVELAGRLIGYNDRPAILAIVTDVSERLRAERARLAAEELLRESQKLEAVGKLTGGVAHDFNNILMVIMANVDAVLEEEEVGDGLKSHIERIGGAAERAAQLTRQLLAFSRKQTLRPQRTNLNDLVVATGAMLRRTLGEHIEIQSLLSEELWPTNTDRAQVEAALINLCINARDAMPEGGRLIVETRNATLDKAYVASNPEATEGDYVMLAVTDSGSGMPPDVLARVFEPFFTTKGVGKGTGLGLSMVYGFVKQSKGHITIQSEVGHGTTVKFYLPRSEQNADETAMVSEPQIPRGNERVLVVEDEAQVRAIVLQQLGSLGYSVAEAANGAEGLEMLRAGKTYDLLLTDVIMPGAINGKMLADHAMAQFPALRVLFMSGYSEDAISTLGILNPGVKLLSKPFRKIDLATAVRQAIDTQPASAPAST